MGKNKKKYYQISKSKNNSINTEFKGLAITTNSYKLAQKEINDILIECIDNNDDNTKNNNDPIDNLEKEIKNIKNNKNFIIIQSKCNNLLLIKLFNDPLIIMQKIINNIINHRIKSRFLQKCLPIITTSYCNIDSIEKSFINNIIPIIESLYTTIQKCQLTIKSMYSNQNKTEINHKICQIINNSPKLLLVNKQQDLNITLILFKNVCMMSVIQDYHKYHKYNLNVLSSK